MTLPPIDLEFLNEGSAIAVPAPPPLGLRPEPVPVSAIRRVSTIALALQALLGTLFLYVLIFAHGALA
jgi:hypothetical protein